MKAIKEGPSIPGWVVGVAVGIVVLGLIAFGMKAVQGDGPRDPSTYPKEAYQPPAYTPRAGAYTKDGKPVDMSRPQ